MPRLLPTVSIGDRFGALVVLVIALAICVVPARAQSPERIGDHLALARVCASEIGLNGDAEECSAILAVLRSRCPRCSVETIARRYSDRVFDLDRHDDRAWVAFLRADFAQPRRWPSSITVRRNGAAVVVEHARWSAFRERWRIVYEGAGRALRGEVTHACVGNLRHFGGRVDRPRAERLGFVRLACPEHYRSDYYDLPADPE